jgi:hypothetical protein
MKAYPFIHKHPTTGNTKLEEGMDLRDWFAGIAMQGLLTGLLADGQDVKWESIAVDAYRQADAMLKAREVKNEHP